MLCRQMQSLGARDGQSSQAETLGLEGSHAHIGVALLQKAVEGTREELIHLAGLQTLRTFE